MKHRTKRYGKKRKTLKGGTHYGAAGAIPGTVGAMQWGPGEEVKAADYQKLPMSGGKRRRGKKRTRRMRGGERYAGGVSASFGGTGERGLANYGPVATRVPHGNASTFNNHGAGPGNWSSFK